MSASGNTLASYDKAFMPALFGAVIAAMFAPFGGVARLRASHAVASGTAQVTLSGLENEPG